MVCVRRMRPLTTWLEPSDLLEVVDASGVVDGAVTVRDVDGRDAEATPDEMPFRLVGRPALEGFFRDHVIDIVENRDRYRAMGISFPSAFVLHGPPGCGKTFGVERLT